jgi:hypothetical protein
MSLSRAADLADELYNELVANDLWEGMKTVNKIAKAHDVLNLEEEVFELKGKIAVLSDLKNKYDWIIRKLEKLDNVHKCTCEACVKYRTKYQETIQWLEMNR